ncbi:MAG: hypothetical protein LCH72_04645 [Proteobacteria bacterium]|nr:hypothetical protein [Burkholderiales bacterium]MCA0309960.1 hypothetical protein [Pseudomonadota bacterium]
MGGNFTRQTVHADGGVALLAPRVGPATGAEPLMRRGSAVTSRGLADWACWMASASTPAAA